MKTRARIRFGAALVVGAVLAAAAGSGGCASRYVKGTKIPDTKDNRAIIDVLRRYQRAVEAKDVSAIVSLAAPTYHEGLGTVGGEDDYGYDRLPVRLTDRFSKIKSLRYVVTVSKIEVTGSRASVFYTYELRFQYLVEGVERWSTETADHRMMLERGDGGWRIVAGL